MIKKIIASAAVLCLCAAITSCGGKNAASSSDEKSTVASSENSISEDNSAESAVSAEQIKKDKVTNDFTGIDSEKEIKLLTSDKYHLILSADVSGSSMKQDIYYTRNGILVNVDFMDTVYSTLYKDGFQYTLIDDIYYKVPVDDADDNSVDMFADYGYVESGETELEGKTYKYDEFYQGTTDTFSKFLIDNNKLYAILSEDGSAMYIEKLDDSFEESILSMPSSAKEVTQEEFNTKFVEKVAGKIEE